MKLIGFSTGALARNDFRQALQMLADKDVNAVELSALRQDELIPLVEQLEQLELDRFQYISFHAPSAIEQSFEPSPTASQAGCSSQMANYRASRCHAHASRMG